MALTVEEREKNYLNTYHSTTNMDTYLIGRYRITVLTKSHIDQYGLDEALKYYFVLNRMEVPYKIAETKLGFAFHKTPEQENMEVAVAKQIVEKVLKAMMYICYNEKKIFKNSNYKKVEEEFVKALENDDLENFNLEVLAEPKTLARSNEALNKLIKEDKNLATILINEFAQKSDEDAPTM